MINAAKISAGPSDRALAALFAPASVRGLLADLHLWAEEIESIPFKAREPAIQAMRFAWHREAVADLFAVPRKVRRHAAYEGLARLTETDNGLTADLLQGVIDAVEDGTLPERIPDEAALLSVMDRHWGLLAGLTLRLCGGAADAGQIRAAARAAGLAQWCRAFSFRAGTKMALVPLDVLEARSFNIHRLASGLEPGPATAIFEPVIALLDAELTALSGLGKCPPEAFPALAPARLARATLKTARRASDLYRTDFHRPQIARQFALLKASMSGRL